MPEILIFSLDFKKILKIVGCELREDLSMDLPIEKVKVTKVEKVQVTQAEIDTAISAGGYLTVSQLGLGIKAGYTTIYTGTSIPNSSKFSIGRYPNHEHNISTVLYANLKKILGDIDIKVEGGFLPIPDGETDYPCEHRITIKDPDGSILFDVRIGVVLEQMPNAHATASDSTLGPLRLKTQGGVVFTLSGFDAQFCKYFLLGDFYNALRSFSPDLDQKKKRLLLLHAFNHPSVPLHSHDIMQEMIPVVIDAILPAAAPQGTLTNQLRIKIKRSVSKQYIDHFQPALASDDYSGVGKLLIISALLMGNLCNEVMEARVIVHGSDIPLATLCKTTLKDFLYRLSNQINCENDMASLIGDIYNNTISLAPGKFKEAFHARIQALATRMEKTTVQDLLPQDKIGDHVMGKFLPHRYKLDSYSIFNWNLKPVAQNKTNYREVATFIFKTNAYFEYDFFVLQNVDDLMALYDAMHKTLKAQWICLPHTNSTSVIFYNSEKWRPVANLEDDTISEAIQPCFFEDVRNVNNKLLILNFDITDPCNLLKTKDHVNSIVTLQNEKYPEFTVCGVGFFNYPIAVNNALGVSSIVSYEQQSHPGEACFEIKQNGFLTQVSGHTVDVLNPTKILEKTLVPFQQLAVNPNKTPIILPQQYQFCLFNLEKKQYCRVSYDLFMQRLTKRLRYDEILVKAKSENPQATLIAEQLFINDFGSLFLQIQIPDFLRPDLKDLLKERLHDIGARVEETYCELQVQPLTSEYASWKEVKNPRFINYAQIITAQGTEKSLYLPDVLMRQFLDNLEEMLANAAYRQTNKVLQKLYKAMHDKGAECWSYIVHICKEMIAESQSGVFGLFGYKKEPTFEDPSDLLVYAIAHTEEHLQRYDLLTQEKKLAIQQYTTDRLISFCRIEIARLEPLEWKGEPRNAPFPASNSQLILLRNLKLALEKFPDATIMNLKQLVIAEQKEQLKAFFAREVTRLTPMKEVPKPGQGYSAKASNVKIAGYENMSHFIDLHPLSHEITPVVIHCLDSIKVECDGMHFATAKFPNGILIGQAIIGSRGYSNESTSSANYKKTVGALLSTFTTPLWDCFKLGVQHEINSEYRDWLVIEESSEDKEQNFDDTPETPDLVPNIQLN